MLLYMDLGASTGKEKYTLMGKDKIKDIEGKILKCSTRAPSSGPFLKPSGHHVLWFHDTLQHPFTLGDVCLVLSFFFLFSGFQLCLYITCNQKNPN